MSEATRREDAYDKAEDVYDSLSNSEKVENFSNTFLDKDEQELADGLQAEILDNFWKDEILEIIVSDWI